MEDTRLESDAQRAAGDIADYINDLINMVDDREQEIVKLYEMVSNKEEENAELSNLLEETLKDLQESEVERLGLLQLIKSFNNVDIQG
jgi:site-specific DNA-adenine methylase